MPRLHTLVAALALVAAACSGGTDDAATSTTTSSVALPSSTSTPPPSTMVVEPDRITSELVVWAPIELVGPIGDAAQGFEIETGIGVSVVATDFETMLESLTADPAGGPDVFFGPHEWLGTLTDAGIAEPLAVRPEVVGGAAGTVQLRGISYAAPIGLDTVAQFRNPSRLSAPPATIESFAGGCGGGACLALPANSVAGHWPFFAGLGGYLFGPDEFDGWDEDDVGIDSPEALAAGEILESIVAGAGILGDADATARQRFVAGAVPLFWGRTADLPALRGTGLGFTVDQLPTIGGQPAPAPVWVTAAWVNAFSPDKEAAVELVEEHLSAPVNARPLAVALGLAPVDFDYDDDPDLAPFTRGAAAGHPVPVVDAVDLAWVDLAEAFEAIRDGGDAATALRGAAANIRAGTAAVVESPPDDSDT